MFDVNSSRRGTLSEAELQQSIALSKQMYDGGPPYTERVDYPSRRRQSEPATDILAGLRAGDVTNRGYRHLDPEVSDEFQQFLQRSKLGIYGKENKHGDDDRSKAKSLENIPENDRISGEVNILSLEEGDSDRETSPAGGRVGVEEDGPEMYKLEKLHLEQGVPSYATSRRRMSLPANAVMPRHLTDARVHKDFAGLPSNSKHGNRRASFSVETLNNFNQKYLNKRHGGGNHHKNGINVTFVDEYTGERDSRRYAVPNTYRGSCEELDATEDNKMTHLNPKEKKIWDDVARCRYIRGYDPPEMRMPTCGPSVFVFGRNLGESIEAHLSDKSADPLETPRPSKKF